MIMLDIKNVRKTFNKNTINEKKALNGINLHLNEGDFVTVIGGNGAGKSTMLNMVAGVYPIDSGKIEIDGINISRYPEYKSPVYRQGFSGSDDGNSCRYGDTGEYGACIQKRESKRLVMGN